MCGRYGRRADKQRIAEWFHTHNTDVFDDTDLSPSYNVAPQTVQPVVRLNHESGKRELTVMEWGLVPYWSKTSKIPYSTINAQVSKLTTSGVWKEPFKHRRCLIPADWFYEWPVIDGKKQAHAFGLQSGSLFAFAGLWDRWRDKESDTVLETFTIVTTDPHEWMERYHDRMGVIVQPKDYDRWLQPGEPSRLPIDLLRPYPEELLKVWRVSNEVGNVKNDRPDLVLPV